MLVQGRIKMRKCVKGYVVQHGLVGKTGSVCVGDVCGASQLNGEQSEAFLLRHAVIRVRRVDVEKCRMLKGCLKFNI